jgi:hypothetical protein
MSASFFKPNENQPAERVPYGIEPVDLGLLLGLLAFAVGLGMIWLPLALVIPGGLVAVVCLWRIAR